MNRDFLCQNYGTKIHNIFLLFILKQYGLYIDKIYTGTA